MSQLCFATFARVLQKVLIQPPPQYNTPTRNGAKQPSVARPKMTSTDVYVVERLLRWIQDLLPMSDKTGSEVWRTGKTVSNLLDQKIELHTAFGPALTDPRLPAAARQAFNQIVKDVPDPVRSDFTTGLVRLIKDDPEISAEQVEKLLNLASTDRIAFYADTFIYAICKPNKKREESPKMVDAALLLASRNGDRCPLCMKEKLFTKVKGERRPVFKVVTFSIDDDGQQTDEEAVCAKCAALIPSGPTLFNDPDVIEHLRTIRGRRLAAEHLQDDVLDAQLHTKIVQVIEGLGDLITTGRAPELTLDAVEVAKKIRPEFFELSTRIRANVLQWYRTVEEQFRNLEGGRKTSRFSRIAEQVADFYQEASEHTDDQQAIFDAVADWIHTNSGSVHRDASIIVTCFFVQNCEVFDEIA